MPVTGCRLRDMVITDARGTASRNDSRRNARLRHPRRRREFRAPGRRPARTPRRRCPAPRATAAALRCSARCRRSPRRRKVVRRANRRPRPSSRCSAPAADSSGARACLGWRGRRFGRDRRRSPAAARSPALLADLHRRRRRAWRAARQRAAVAAGTGFARRRGNTRCGIARSRARQHPPDGERQHQRATQTHQRRHQAARIGAPLGVRHLREIGRRRPGFALAVGIHQSRRRVHRRSRRSGAGGRARTPTRRVRRNDRLPALR